MVIVLSILGAAVLAAYLLYVYADRKHCPPYVLALVWTTWSLGLVFFFLLPFDLSSTSYARCTAAARATLNATLTDADPPNGTTVGALGGVEAAECTMPPWGAHRTLSGFWTFAYWTSMLLGYFMSDFLRDAIASGAFTVGGRIRGSLRNGAMFYVPFCLIGLGFLGYQLVRGSVTFSGLRAYCKAAANAFSLFVVVIMLGYGLVEVPRYLWNRGDIEGQLRHLLFKLGEYKKASNAATIRLVEAFGALEFATGRVRDAQCYGDPVELAALCARVAAHAEPAELDPHRSGITAVAVRLHAEASGGSAPLAGLVSLQELEGIHFRIKEGLLVYRRARALESEAMEKALLQSDIRAYARSLEEASWREQSGGKRQRLPSGPPGQDAGATVPSFPRGLLDARYRRVTVEPLLWRSVAACCAVLSLVLALSESTILLREVVNLSIISHLLMLDASGGPAFLIAFSIPLVYNACCVYFAFFRMKLFNFYALHTGGNSDYGSLLFNGTYMCRLAPALAYNYLNLLHESHHAEETGVTSGYLEGLGEMNVVPFLGEDYYNDLAPILIVLVGGCTYLNCFSQAGALCGGKRFQFEDQSDDDIIADGARILEAEKRRRLADADEQPTVPPTPVAERSEDGAYEGRRPLGVAVASPHTPH